MKYPALPSARWLTALLLAALLAGCAATPPPAPVAVPWSAEQAALLDRYAIRGKVGFRRGDTGGSANLVWQQEGDRYRLSANGPLGQGATRITGNAAVVRIENNQGVRDSSNPEALLAEAIGWPVSINSLAWWVRGLAAPAGEATIERDPQGRPARIRQQDWDIQLDRWREDAGYVLPHRIIATGGDSRVTLLVERWEFPPRNTRPTPLDTLPAAPISTEKPGISGSASTDTQTP